MQDNNNPPPSAPVAQEPVATDIEDLIERVLDAQQDIDLEANMHMSQSLCDAAALLDDVETALRRLAAPVAAQPSVQNNHTQRFMVDVAAELDRARAKFPGDRIMTIALAEEFGELAKAMLDEPGANVWKEAVQTAVMAARVAIDGDSSVDEWRTVKGLDNHRNEGHS